MSKAFVKDDSPLEEVGFHQRPLTSDSENYMTAGGFERLKAELAKLRLDKGASLERIQYLEDVLATAKVVTPENQDGDRVLFGATVKVTNEAGVQRTYTLVGVNETNASEGLVSWISPIGKALLNARVGDSVVFRTPRGEEELTVDSILR